MICSRMIFVASCLILGCATAKPDEVPVLEVKQPPPQVEQKQYGRRLSFEKSEIAGDPRFKALEGKLYYFAPGNTDAGGYETWDLALGFIRAENLKHQGLGGHRDWRLPSRDGLGDLSKLCMSMGKEERDLYMGCESAWTSEKSEQDSDTLGDAYVALLPGEGKVTSFFHSSAAGVVYVRDIKSFVRQDDTYFALFHVGSYSFAFLEADDELEHGAALSLVAKMNEQGFLGRRDWDLPSEWEDTLVYTLCESIRQADGGIREPYEACESAWTKSQTPEGRILAIKGNKSQKRAYRDWFPNYVLLMRWR